jgi:hypothetical protein
LSFFVFLFGIRIAVRATHEALPHNPRIYFFGWGSHCLPADRASTSVVKSGTAPVSTESCVDRYNSLLKNAKTALTAGNRAATVDLLEQAKQMLPACPALQDGPSPHTLRL